MTDPTDHYLILSDLTLKNAQLLYPIAIFASKSIEQVKNVTSTTKKPTPTMCSAHLNGKAAIH